MFAPSRDVNLPNNPARVGVAQTAKSRADHASAGDGDDAGVVLRLILQAIGIMMMIAIVICADCISWTRGAPEND